MVHLINFDTSSFVIISLFFISIGYSAIIHFNYSFLHLLLIFEMIFISICFFFSITGFIVDQISGDVMALFIVGIVAAETAVGISFYINTIIGLPDEKNENNHENTKIIGKKITESYLIKEKISNTNKKFIIFNAKK